MQKRLLLAATTAALAATAAPAYALNGITPVSPKKGDSVPAGKAVTFKMDVEGEGTVFVRVCKSKKKNGQGLICKKGTIGQAKKKRGSRWEYKQRNYNFAEYWLMRPGTWYWQAYRIACENGTADCNLEGPTIKFKVK